MEAEGREEFLAAKERWSEVAGGPGLAFGGKVAVRKGRGQEQISVRREIELLRCWAGNWVATGRYSEKERRPPPG